MTINKPLVTLSELTAARNAMRHGFSLREISAEDASEFWSVRDGALQHRTNGFFVIGGFRDPRDGSEHLMLYQPQGAINGLATTMVDGERAFLVQSRAEPGNVGEVQFGPTLQSTPANWMRIHGGAPHPFAAMFLQHAPEALNLVETVQLDLGSRYILKSKRVALAETATMVPLPTGFHWVSAGLVVEALEADYLFNTDLRAAMAVAPWSSDVDSGELVPRSAAVRRSLAAPLRPETLGGLIAQLQTSDRVRPEPIAIEAMQNWGIASDGIHEREPRQRISVAYFEVEANAREVAKWIQPLVVGHGEGRSMLACRDRDGMIEVWVSVRSELGLANGVALAPSHLTYPGDEVSVPEWLSDATPWVETRESDEGGRFLTHQSACTLVIVAEGRTPPPEARGAWVRVSELKHLLGISNQCMIQLRTISSLLLHAE